MVEIAENMLVEKMLPMEFMQLQDDVRNMVSDMRSVFLSNVTPDQRDFILNSAKKFYGESSKK